MADNRIETLTDVARAIGRIEGKVDSIAEDVVELKEHNERQAETLLSAALHEQSQDAAISQLQQGPAKRAAVVGMWAAALATPAGALLARLFGTAHTAKTP
jgi:hypothetical protein